MSKGNLYFQGRYWTIGRVISRNSEYVVLWYLQAEHFTVDSRSPENGLTVKIDLFEPDLLRDKRKRDSPRVFLAESSPSISKGGVFAHFPSSLSCWLSPKEVDVLAERDEYGEGGAELSPFKSEIIGREFFKYGDDLGVGFLTINDLEKVSEELSGEDGECKRACVRSVPFRTRFVSNSWENIETCSEKIRSCTLSIHSNR